MDNEKVRVPFNRIINIEKKSDEKSQKFYFCIADLSEDVDKMTNQEYHSAYLALYYGAHFVLFNNTPDAEINAIWYAL